MDLLMQMDLWCKLLINRFRYPISTQEYHLNYKLVEFKISK